VTDHSVVPQQALVRAFDSGSNSQRGNETMNPRSEPLDAAPLWLLFLGSCMVSVLAVEVGFHFGTRRRRATPETEGPVAGIVASVLALFAFLLAFTFSSAASRFEARRQMVLEEANSIGTAYLRAQMIHEPRRSA
jgi:hypothetical protein